MMYSVGDGGFEPPTSCLSSMRSKPTELIALSIAAFQRIANI